MSSPGPREKQCPEGVQEGVLHRSEPLLELLRNHLRKVLQDA